jgi:hypothetical protein
MSINYWHITKFQQNKSIRMFHSFSRTQFTQIIPNFLNSHCPTLNNVCTHTNHIMWTKSFVHSRLITSSIYWTPMRKNWHNNQCFKLRSRRSWRNVFTGVGVNVGCRDGIQNEWTLWAESKLI